MIKWQNLIKDLQKQRCVLLLGDALPYVSCDIIFFNSFSKKAIL